MIGVPVSVEDLVDAPIARFGGVEHGLIDRGIDRGGLAVLFIVDQPHIIVAKRGDGDDFDHHHSPVLGIDDHGWEGPSASPF